jgi:regulator of PEP synthase PpsR (kinase-PPPase family)
MCRGNLSRRGIAAITAPVWLRTSLENCRYEVAAAEKMMKREGVKWFDTTSRSIEEPAVQLMRELKRER